jgi:flagellar basal body rod protein FlgC
LTGLPADVQTQFASRLTITAPGCCFFSNAAQVLQRVAEKADTTGSLRCSNSSTAMNSTLSIAMSGLNAASTRLNVSAHNIANSQTPEFRRQQVEQTALAEGGVSVSLDTASEFESAPLASLTEDVVQQMSAAYAFKANLKVIQTEQDLLGQLLDLRA